VLNISANTNGGFVDNINPKLLTETAFYSTIDAMLKQIFGSLMLVFAQSANANDYWTSLYQMPDHIEHSYARVLGNGVVGTRVEQYWSNGRMTFTVEYFNCKDQTYRLVGKAYFYDSGELDFKHRPEDTHFAPADTKSRSFAFACTSHWSDLVLLQ
jgi:hypothetical protein